MFCHCQIALLEPFHLESANINQQCPDYSVKIFLEEPTEFRPELQVETHFPVQILFKPVYVEVGDTIAPRSECENE